VAIANNGIADLPARGFSQVAVLDSQLLQREIFTDHPDDRLEAALAEAFAAYPQPLEGSIRLQKRLRQPLDGTGYVAIFDIYLSRQRNMVG
jgi:hypothetical protein